jgi:hypothetical protein
MALQARYEAIKNGEGKSGEYLSALEPFAATSALF